MHFIAELELRPERAREREERLHASNVSPSFVALARALALDTAANETSLCIFSFFLIVL